MANRTIELTLKANTQGLINGVRTARRAARDAGWELDKFRQQNEQAWNTVGRTVTAAGTAIGNRRGLSSRRGCSSRACSRPGTRTVAGVMCRTQATRFLHTPEWVVEAIRTVRDVPRAAAPQRAAIQSIGQITPIIEGLNLAGLKRAHTPP